MSPKIVNKEKRKEELLNAAMVVFAKNGYANTTMDSVAKYASVSKGMLYEYFPSKEELLVELSSHFDKVFSAKIERKLAEIKDPKEKIRIFIKYAFEVYSEMADFINILFIFWCESMIKTNTNKLDLKSMCEIYRKHMAQIITEGIETGYFRKVDPYMFASLIIASMDGLCLHLQLIPEEKLSEVEKKSPEELSQMILKSLEKKE